MTIPRLTFLLVVTCSLLMPAAAQETGLSFLQLGPNPEGMALGDALVANSRDAYATYWNPAGLAGGDPNSASVSHHIWIADVRTYAAATRLGFGRNGALGFSATATGTSDLEARDGPGGPSGLFSAQFLSVGASYGRAVGPVRAGLTAKYLSERIFTTSSSGYAFDFGLQADVLDGGVALGAALLNVGRMEELVESATRLPRMLRLGAAVYPFQILSVEDRAPVLNAVVLAQVSQFLVDGGTRIHLGLGAEVVELVTARLGYVSNDDLRSFTFGLGLDYEAFKVDYAFVPFESGFDGPGHVIGLTYRW